jgi:hypothetical protein
LAVHGKGCIELIVKEYGDAYTNLEAADSLNVCFSGLMLANELCFSAKAMNLKPEELLADLSNPGMSLRTREESVTRAQQDFTISDSLSKMTALPFNQHLSHFFDGMGAREAASLDMNYGKGTAGAELSSHQMGQAMDYVRRNDMSGGSSLLADSSGKILDAAAKAAANLPIKNLNPAVRVGLQALPTLANNQNNIGNDFKKLNGLDGDILKQNYGSQFPRTSSQQPLSQPPGGVLVKVDVQDGNWPFIPIYGLAYGAQN